MNQNQISGRQSLKKIHPKCLWIHFLLFKLITLQFQVRSVQ